MTPVVQASGSGTAGSSGSEWTAVAGTGVTTGTTFTGGGTINYTLNEVVTALVQCGILASS